MATSYGPQIDALLHEYLHSDAMRDRVSDAARVADAAVKAELAPHTKTGALFAASDAQVEEFAAGYGMSVSTRWVSYFNFNVKGIRRLREPGYRRGTGMRRKRGYKKHAPVMKVSRPSVIGTAVETFGREIDLWKGTP